jgi:hypothetical protein
MNSGIIIKRRVKNPMPIPEICVNDRIDILTDDSRNRKPCPHQARGGEPRAR